MNSFFDVEYLQMYINERAAKLIADLDLGMLASAFKTCEHKPCFSLLRYLRLACFRATACEALAQQCYETPARYHI